jgi:hypothetical protein
MPLVRVGGLTEFRCEIRSSFDLGVNRLKIPSLIGERSVGMTRVPNTSVLRVGVLVLLCAEEITF